MMKTFDEIYQELKTEDMQGINTESIFSCRHIVNVNCIFVPFIDDIPCDQFANPVFQELVCAPVHKAIQACAGKYPFAFDLGSLPEERNLDKQGE